MIKTTIKTKNGNKTLLIPTLEEKSGKEIKLSPAQENKIIDKFNRETRCMEWVGGNTYFVSIKGHRLKSSSLDELFEMYKAAWLGIPIPERQAFFNK